MSKAEIIKILETRKKPVSVTQMMKLTGKGRSTLNHNLRCLLREPEPMIKVIKKIEYYRIISYYSLVK